MDLHDLAAMRLAIEVLRKDPELGDSVAAMLQNQSEQEVGLFAASICQTRSLKLKAWECPPCDSANVETPSDHYGARPNEVMLLRQMLAAGVSRYHPDPMRALTEVERAA
jgi:hypothetical protein